MTTANNSSTMNPTQRALLAVKAMRKKLEDVTYQHNEPLAVVGMSCRLPGGIKSPDDFWQLLCNQEDAITDIPPDRWDINKHYDPDPAEPGKMYVRQGGFINDVYHFDRDLFGLSKRESMSMDPQQRLLLELSWEALERSGIAPRSAQSRKRTGLFVGMATNDYARFHIHSNNLNDIDVYSFTGCAPSIASGRISQLLDLGGPTLSVDTACSSSIVALHLARQSILANECEQALVGGVNLVLSPENTVYFCKTSALSPLSRCKTFDESADGYVRSEGGGIIVIKRLSKAIADNDNILAVLQGSAINHDGEGIGLTAPNGDAQQRLVEKALHTAGISPSDIGFIETHGTGTPLGDPIELQALGRVFKERDTALAIGSCKSNIGHTEAAAGIAGILKTVLCLQHKTLVPNLHFNQPSSFIPWDKLPLRVVQQVEAWQPINGKRLAGVSSFGFSGTNAHAIFTEAPQSAQHTSPANDTIDSEEQVLAISGKSPERLKALLNSTLNHVRQHTDLALNSFCYSMNRGKTPFIYRNLIRFQSRDELIEKLTALTQTTPVTVKQEGADLPLLSLNVGDCDNVLQALHTHLQACSPAYTNRYQQCQESFAALTPTNQDSPVFLAEYSDLPERFSIYYAWITLLQDLCGSFDYIHAEGVGLLAAECVTGALRFDDAIHTCHAFITGRQHTLNSVVNATNKTTCLVGGVTLANKYNFDSWYQCLTETSGVHMPLSTMATHATVIIDCSGKHQGTQVISASPVAANTANIVNTISEALYLRGYAMRWEMLYQGQNVHMVATPCSAFMREELRLPAPNTTQANTSPIGLTPPHSQVTRAERSANPLLGQPVFLPNQNKRIFQQRLAPNQVPFLLDHGFLDEVVVPATAYLEIINATLRTITHATSIHLDDISYHAGLYLPKDDAVYIQVEIDEDQIALYSAPEKRAQNSNNNAWTLHCTATHTSGNAVAAVSDIQSQVQALKQQPTDANLYPALNTYGYLFGPAHQGVTKLIHQDAQTTIALVEAHATIDAEFAQYHFHPAHLDACCHAILELLDRSSPDSIFITVGKDRVHIYQQAEKIVFVRARAIEQTENSVKANLDIYALDGTCIAQVEGYTMKRVNRAQLQAHAGNATTSNPVISSDIHEEWLYSNRWQPITTDTSSALPSGRWLITGYTSDTNAAMAATLQQLLQQTLLQPQLVALSELSSAITQAQQANENVHIIHLCTDNDRLLADSAEQVIGKTAYDGYMSFTEIVKAIRDASVQVSLYTLTAGAVPVDGSESHLNFSSATLWGAGRSLILEHPHCRFANIDLDPSLPLDTFTALKSIFSGHYNQEDQFAIRNNQLFINRLIPIDSVPDHATDDLPIADKQHFQLAIDEQGSIDNLRYITTQPETLEADDVEITATAAALSFYDVVTALDLVDGSRANTQKTDECRFGQDVVGQISRVGSAVSRYQPGDWVMGFSHGCIASHVRIHQDCVSPKPQNLSLLESAVIPTSFLTAYYALHTLAKIQPGDSVLIHAAAGGVGIAAINLAKVIGAEIYATASEAKWPLLRSLGVKHIYNSRTLEFAEQILADTEGKGVNIVLNSLIGEYIQKNVDVLAPGGRFVELGERDLLSDAQVNAFNKPFTYASFSLFSISRDKPAEIKAMFEQLQSVWKSPAFSGIPYQPYTPERIKDAFRVIQQGQHKGKLVVTITPTPKPTEATLQQTKAALITGGLGGIGWAVTQWLAQSNTETLYVMGRSASNDAIAAQIAPLARGGKTVKYISADVGNASDVKRVFAQIAADGVTLTAVLHAAGLMNNALMVNEAPVDAAEVLTAKTLGTWFLHQASQDLVLEHFICFSSTTALLGAAGAASYAAGNAFVDSLMQYRRNLGLAAQAINWGAWQEVGMLTRLNTAAQEYWQENGMQALPTAVALSMLNHVSQRGEARVAILPADWAQWKQQYTKLPSLLLAVDKQSHTGTAITPAPQTVITPTASIDTHQLVSDSIRKVLRLEPSAVINEDKSFREMGIDSLMSVELRNILSKAIGEKLSSTLLFNYANINALSDYLQSQFAHKQQQMSPQVTQTPTIQRVDVLTVLTEQLKTLLRLEPGATLNEQDPFKNMGIDSLMSVELRNTLSKKLGVKLSSTVLFNYTTIELLAAHLDELVNQYTESPAVTTATVTPIPTLASATSQEPQEEPGLAELRAMLDAKLMEMDN